MPRKVALLIGVGQYAEDSGLQSLQCPQNGVAAVESLLRDVNIGGFNEVIALPNPDVGSARSRIGEVFGGLAKDDLALFYFTGHGIKDMGGKFYLTTAETRCFADGRLNPGTALEADFIKGVIGSSYAQRKVIILDCCFGAAIADGFLTMDDGGVDVDAQLGGEGWVVLTAATSRNYALEQPGEPLSVYTRYLVEGLKTGTAAPEGQAYISVRNLHDYVRAKVKTAAPTMEPAIFNGHQGDNIVLAKATLGDPERRYRQELEAKIRQGHFRQDHFRPATRANLDLLRTQLGLTAERAQALEHEVLQPYREKQQHIDRYAATLQAEIAYAFPLDAEAIQELRTLQKRLNLTDDDLRPIIANALHNALHQNAPASLVKSLLADAPAYWFEVVTVNAEGEVANKTIKTAEYFREDLGDGITLDLVRIPAGQFLMGSPDSEKSRDDNESPQHRVMVPEFWLGKYPITQAQYQAIMGTNPSCFAENGANRPVEQVSWLDAVAFCEKLSQTTGRTYRLPSEAEWEYACRAGTTTPFHFGPTLTSDLANYDGNYTYANGPNGTYREQTTEVGQFPPNAFGLYDMHGNVWEWCADHWHPNYDEAPMDGSAWLSPDESKSRLLRGGSWLNELDSCRSANRPTAPGPGDHFYNVSFRVVCAATRVLS